MKKSSAPYQVITKVTAFLLLMAFLIPTGLHAKQLVDFCLTDRADVEMAADHSCCESNAEDQNQKADSHQHHDCEGGFICACNISDSALSDEVWVQVKNTFGAYLTENVNLTAFFTSSEYIQTDQQIRIGEYDPPLWLLYDTFLN